MRVACRGSRRLTWPAFSRWVASAFLLLTSLLLAGCASITLSVVQDNQLAHGPAIDGVSILRQGVPAPPETGMAIEPGDQIRTGERSTVVLDFVDGARVYVLPGSHVQVGSIRVFLGEVLVKVKGYFKVETRYLTAGSQGTEYLVHVDRSQASRVVVAEGSVGLSLTRGNWPQTTLQAGQQARVAAPAMLELGTVGGEEIRAIRELIRHLDQVVPAGASAPQELTPAVSTILIEAVKAWASGRGSADRQPDRTPDRQPGRYPQREPAPADSAPTPSQTPPLRLHPSVQPSRVPQRIPPESIPRNPVRSVPAAPD